MNQDKGLFINATKVKKLSGNRRIDWPQQSLPLFCQVHINTHIHMCTHTHTHRVIFMHHNSLNTFKRKNKKRHRVRASFYFSRSTMCYIFPDQSINVYKDSMITLMACWGMLLEGIFYLIMHIILYIGL